MDRLPGTDTAQALELIYESANQCAGILLLNRPSPRSAVAAVLGALKSGSGHGPARIYLADPRREQLMLAYAELSKIELAIDVTLYHGSLSQFFGDLPLGVDLICTDFSGLDAFAGLRSSVPPGAILLTLQTAAPQHLIEGGVLQLEAAGPGGSVYRTTQLCQGDRFVPNAGLRVKLQARLHALYFLPESAAAHASHTPVADLTEEIRREFSRAFPAASGSGTWPYAATESTALPATLPSGKPWPKISIVTPSRNQGNYIQETILSVLHQNYPNVEHIIVDSVSTDETPAILERYRHRLALVISEPDQGQSDAINKGMSKATGDILTWLNSDDMLAPGALAAVALAFDLHGVDMIAGVCRMYREGRLETQYLTSCPDGPLPIDDLLDLDHGWHAGRFFIQPEVMFTREIWLRAGGHVAEQLHYVLDYELWLRFARAGARLHVIGRPVAWFRLHEEQKTQGGSNVLRELDACRGAFLKDNNLKQQSKPVAIPWREKLRIAVLDDIAGERLACALAWAGHDVSIGNTLDQLSASRPDLVITSSVAERSRFPTIVKAPQFESVPLDIFRPRDRQACRKQLGLPLDRFLILLPESSGKDALARLDLPNVSIEVAQPDAVSDREKLALLYSAADVVVASNSREVTACGTPVLASDDNPASLAAAIHHLYIHPELRSDLARWGRLYAENEWSEFSAYRHIFTELEKSGLIKSLNLRRRIAFLPQAPALLTEP